MECKTSKINISRLRQLETPFYLQSLRSTQWNGNMAMNATGKDLDKSRKPWVRIASNSA
jgi:hypothetical protein